MRTKKLIALALAFLIAASGGAFARDFANKALGVSEGPRLNGFLTWAHFRPSLAGACDEPAQQQAALASYYVEHTVKRQFAAWLAPRPAFASKRAPCAVMTIGGQHNLIVNSGENFMVDAFQNLTELENLRFHGMGTGATAAAETDTGCQTELTTQYNPDNTRATGSLTEGASANIFRTVGTNTVDSAVTITEFCLMSQAATGGGTMWSRVVFSGIALASADSLQFTYHLTVE